MTVSRDRREAEEYMQARFLEMLPRAFEALDEAARRAIGEPCDCWSESSASGLTSCRLREGARRSRKEHVPVPRPDPNAFATFESRQKGGYARAAKLREQRELVEQIKLDRLADAPTPRRRRRARHRSTYGFSPRMSGPSESASRPRSNSLKFASSA
jgi:hypothetical protein